MVSKPKAGRGNPPKRVKPARSSAAARHAAERIKNPTRLSGTRDRIVPG